MCALSAAIYYYFAMCALSNHVCKDSNDDECAIDDIDCDVVLLCAFEYNVDLYRDVSNIEASSTGQILK